MGDDASRRNEVFRWRHRSSAEQDTDDNQDTEDTGNGWFTSEQPATEAVGAPNEPTLPTHSTPDLYRGQPPEQRYADAVGSLNEMVTTQRFEDLPWVLGVLRTTLGVLHEHDPGRASVLNNLGSACQLSHLRTGDTEDLEDAVEFFQASVGNSVAHDPDRLLYLSNLALALSELADQTSSAEHAHDAVRAARRAAERTDRTNHRRCVTLARLGKTLKQHARLANEPASDDESIDVFREALQDSPPNGVSLLGQSPGHEGGHESRRARADRCELLIDLGSALLRRYERAGADDDLDEGIARLRAGVDGLADSAPRRGALCHLANALRVRYQLTGEVTDLDAAITESLGILGLLEPAHPLLGKVAWDATRAAAEHLDSTGDPAQLRRTLRAVRPIIREIAPSDPHRAAAFASFAALMRRHFLHGADAETLDTAVAAGEAAIRATSMSTRRCAMVNSLVTTLIARYEHADSDADLDHATTLAQEAADHAPNGVASQYTAWAQLGFISVHRFRRTSQSADLERAVDMFDRALATMPETAPERASVSTQLGRALQTLYQRTGRRRLYRWARRVLTEAATQATAPADQRLRAASLCGRLAAQAHRWIEARDAFTIAVGLLPLAIRGKRVVASPTAQQRWALLAADAAACAIETGEHQRAVELLEQGRYALLADFLPAASELGALHQDQPELADESVRLRRLLDKPAGEPALDNIDGMVDVGSRREQLAQQWEELLGDIRDREGHTDHLRPVSVEELNLASEDGAVVLINLSRYRSDALIVFGGRVLIVPLLGASVESANEQATKALAAVDKRDMAGLSDALDWLWHNITRPVLDRMGYVETPASGQRWPRLWWNVAGPLAFLPLHAATAKSGQSALDRVVSSYTPTIRTLVEAKQRSTPTNGDQRPLVAAGSTQRAAYGLPPENQLLARYWPTAVVMTEEAHSPADILEALRQHPWVHLCEPSTQYPSQPAGGLLLDRESPNPPLSLYELGQVTFDQGEFAYVGQCGTGSDSPTAASTPLGFPLSYAGFAHVVSTLWEIEETAAIEVHSDVYGALTQNGAFNVDDTPLALHHASRRLREEKPEQPASWAGYVHIGP